MNSMLQAQLCRGIARRAALKCCVQVVQKQPYASSPSPVLSNGVRAAAVARSRSGHRDITRAATQGSRGGEGINKKQAQTKTLYILILTNSEASVCASTPGELLARAADTAEKPHRVVPPGCPSAADACFYTVIKLNLCSAMTV